MLKAVIIFLYACGLVFTISVLIINLRDKVRNQEEISVFKVLLIALFIWLLSPLWILWGIYKFLSIFIKR